jgi:hypothetical protein
VVVPLQGKKRPNESIRRYRMFLTDSIWTTITASNTARRYEASEGGWRLSSNHCTTRVPILLTPERSVTTPYVHRQIISQWTFLSSTVCAVLCFLMKWNLEISRENNVWFC